jgi:hypothetical protein
MGTVGASLPGSGARKGIAALAARAAARVRERRAAMAEERETKRLWDGMADLSAYVGDDDAARRSERAGDAAWRLAPRDTSPHT